MNALAKPGATEARTCVAYPTDDAFHGVLRCTMAVPEVRPASAPAPAQGRPLRVGLLADVHDHVHALRRALPWLAQHTDVLLVLGDLVAPFVLRRIAEGYEGTVHVVFGNNDGDRHLLGAVAAGFPHVRMHGELYRGVLGGRRVAAQHFPTIAELIDPTAADLIAFGHDHRARAFLRGDAWAVNPGTLMGYDPAADAEVPASWAVYDAGQHTVAFWRLTGDGAIEGWKPGG
jgi:uncharacterized protein